MNLQTATTSTLLQESVPAEARVILKGVSWSTFKGLMADIGEDRSCRIAYDQGMLEIIVPYEPRRWERSLQFLLTSGNDQNSTYR